MIIHKNFPAGVIITDGLGLGFNALIPAKFHLFIIEVVEELEKLLEFVPGDLVFYITGETSKPRIQEAIIKSVGILTLDSDEIIHVVRNKLGERNLVGVNDEDTFGDLNSALTEYGIRLDALTIC